MFRMRILLAPSTLPAAGRGGSVRCGEQAAYCSFACMPVGGADGDLVVRTRTKSNPQPHLEDRVPPRVRSRRSTGAPDLAEGEPAAETRDGGSHGGGRLASEGGGLLEKSNALENLWQRPVTGEQLQAELERMARDTHDPDMLREMFDALGNDPTLLAETLARPILAGRLIRDWYASDERFHGHLKSRARRRCGLRPRRLHGVDGGDIGRPA